MKWQHKLKHPMLIYNQICILVWGLAFFQSKLMSSVLKSRTWPALFVSPCFHHHMCQLNFNFLSSPVLCLAFYSIACVHAPMGAIDAWHSCTHIQSTNLGRSMKVPHSSQTSLKSCWLFSCLEIQSPVRSPGFFLQRTCKQGWVLTCPSVQALINWCTVQDLPFNVTRNWLRPSATLQRSAGLAGWAMRGGTPKVET